MSDRGIYIHIPFCDGKCPYCDFYSHRPDDGELDQYTDFLCENMHRLLPEGITADTLYFGGGTPSLLGARRLVRIKKAVEKNAVLSDPEITVEVNPSRQDTDFDMLFQNGFNRLSFGLQSANDKELMALGRRHSVDDVRCCVKAAQKSGFDNISLDLMLCTPHQTTESLMRSIDFCNDLGACHISAYILKIEQGTRFYDIKDTLSLPDDDSQADMYLAMCDRMEKNGYIQYEVSNFSKKGRESRHNLKYWHDEEYIGIGPSAHSFYNSRGYYYRRSMQDFYEIKTIDDGTGGGRDEYIMLALRLSQGVIFQKYRERFNEELPKEYIDRAKSLSGTGYLTADDNAIRLTKKGFLVSNAIISRILDE